MSRHVGGVRWGMRTEKPVMIDALAHREWVTSASQNKVQLEHSRLTEGGYHPLP
jgi:hypothetical protein